MTADMLEIRVLGDFQVLSEGAPVGFPPSKKTKALLAFLAVTGKPHQRERLCEMFWDIPDDPKASLRWSLSKIRQLLPEEATAMLQADRSVVQMQPGRRLDLERLGPLDRSALADRSTEELEATYALMAGPFLADVSLPRCPDFEAWRTALCNELEIGRLNLLRELVSRLEGDPARALRYAHAMGSALPGNAEIGRQIERLNRSALAQAAATPSADVPPTPAPETRPAQDLAHQEVRFCHGAGGVRIAYAIAGQGKPVLRAAHWMSHLHYDWESPVWRHWMHALSERNRLVRYDERCNGLSDSEAEDLSFEAMVEDLERVVEAAGLERFTLLGISQSCAISVAYATRHPERISGLVLYGGYVKGWRKRGNPREVAMREALATLMREGWGQNNARFRQLFTSMFIQDATEEHIAALDALQSRTISPDNAWRLQNSFGDIDVSDLLPKVKVPTLVLHARDDAVAPVSSGRTFAAEIANARFIELDSGNHILTENEPAFGQFVRHFRAFVDATS
jgi:pimeloyl-ACP methyl ester carboxylesterase/DNA-binding SARP family transcriptional activator